MAFTLVVMAGGDGGVGVCAGPLAGGSVGGRRGQDGVRVGGVGASDRGELAGVDCVGAAPAEAVHAVARVLGAECAAEDAVDAEDKSGNGVVAVAAIGGGEGQFRYALDDVGPDDRSCGVGGVGHGVRGGVRLVAVDSMPVSSVGRPPLVAGAIFELAYASENDNRTRKW